MKVKSVQVKELEKGCCYQLCVDSKIPFIHATKFECEHGHFQQVIIQFDDEDNTTVKAIWKMCHDKSPFNVDALIDVEFQSVKHLSKFINTLKSS